MSEIVARRLGVVLVLTGGGVAAYVVLQPRTLHAFEITVLWIAIFVLLAGFALILEGVRR